MNQLSKMIKTFDMNFLITYYCEEPGMFINVNVRATAPSMIITLNF